MRLFLDTNVLVSAFAVRGLSADLLDVVLLEHDLVTGRAVLQELEKALRSKIKLPAERCAEIVEYVSSEAVMVVENASRASCNAEEDDRLVLGEALLGGAEAFVTGDAALVALGSLEGMRILTPRQLWELLRSG
ncbi:MAG TPA: putative toxin-antitoxin system toxin component, PIN family [Burkholderiales bacterium]|nr:putative toxin-antitoxin system toxin component, PIN family [Burkholderiales bacterium]